MNLSLEQKEFLLNFLSNHLEADFSLKKDNDLKRILFLYDVIPLEIHFDEKIEFYSNGRMLFNKENNSEPINLPSKESTAFDILSILIENDYYFNYAGTDKKVFVSVPKTVLKISWKNGLYRENKRITMLELVELLRNN